MDYNTKKGLFDYMASFITEARRRKFLEIINFRTKYITIVLEDIYQPHNASAVLRTAECLGIHYVHIIENRNKYNVNPDIALGSSKWIDLIQYSGEDNNTSVCYDKLKKDGYRIIATTPHKSGYSLKELPLDKPIAIVLGNELDGLSDYAHQNADEFMKVPLYGFTESYNISVCAAIILSHLTDKLHASSLAWQLAENERTDILLQWVRNSLKIPDKIERDYLKKIKL